MWRRTMTDLLDRMIPHSVWRSNPSPEIIAQARTLVAVLAFSILGPLVALLIVISLYLFGGKELYAAMISLTAVIALLSVQHMLFQASARLEMTALAFSVTFFVIVIGAIAFTGGWQSPVTLLLFCTPMMTHLISGAFQAFISVLVTFAAWLVFLAVHLSGIELPNIMHSENLPYVQALVWLMAVAIQLLLFGTQAWIRSDNR